MSTMDQPDMSKPHDIVVNALDSDVDNGKVQLLCSCTWTYQGHRPFVDAIKNRHLGSQGIGKIA